MQVAPTTTQLIERAQKAERDLEGALEASVRLRDQVNAVIKLMDIACSFMGSNEGSKVQLIRMYLSEARNDFDAWDDLPF